MPTEKTPPQGTHRRQPRDLGRVGSAAPSLSTAKRTDAIKRRNRRRTKTEPDALKGMYYCG